MSKKMLKTIMGQKKRYSAVSKIYRVILNLYGDPPYKNQTSEKRYKVPTKALPPMRDFASPYFLNRHTYFCMWKFVSGNKAQLALFP